MFFPVIRICVAVPGKAVLPLFFCLLAVCGETWAAPVEKVQRDVVDAVHTEADAQTRLDAWNAERDALLDEARTLKLELQWLRLHGEKLSRYVKANAEKIDLLERAQARYAVIALELEHTLVADVDRLEAHIASTPPFLPEERSHRLAFLKKTLDDPELSIGEKFRRVAEALNAEVEYGRKLELSNQTAMFDGTRMELIVIRAGLVGFYCLTPDRTRAGIWDPAGGSFVPCDKQELRAILNLERMAHTKRYHDIALLPVRLVPQ
ncbi:MAG: DUF3450 domain-containing protein [Desulfovibrio sp.]|jgi:hypothetical protein|nr:DUF3450 domain-containing protein [Desulfovibrio sp.]